MNQKCKEIRKNILNISHASGHGHIPTCFSVVEILWAFYESMKHNPQNPQWDERDIFILSKGHAALAQYCVLAEQGYFPLAEVYSFGSFQSDFGCHADHMKIPGIEVSTGSLGHGIGLAVGIALAFKLEKTERRVFTVVGDGESNEGSVWEAVLAASNLGLNNLTIIYDNNKSHTRGLQIMNPVKKFDAFGCQVNEVNGHDISALMEAYTIKTDRVHAVIADTKKGYPCRDLIEDQYAWHRRSPTKEEVALLLEELDAATI
jgi:transketolase